MNIVNYISRQLQEREELVTVVRRHPSTIVPAVGLGGLLVVLDFFLLTWWFRHQLWGIIGFAVVLIVGLFMAARAVYVWGHNALAVTSQRVIDIDQRGFFERNVAEATYDKIQDVRYTIRGLWSTIFRFGTIIVQTAGSTTNLELESVSHPSELQQLIIESQRRAQAKTSNDLSAHELLNVVDRLKHELGPEGVDRLLQKEPHAENRE